MKETRFGRMVEIHLGAMLSPKCEIMHFRSSGDPHRHPYEEVAIVASGAGIIWKNGVKHPVSDGDVVHIPAGTMHHIEPDEGVVLCMFIGYLKKNPETDNG